MQAPLSANALFSGVPAVVLVRVLPEVRIVTYPCASVLYARGGAARHVFLVVSGSVAIVQRVYGLDVTLARLGAGEFTGECALLGPAVAHLWTAICREESRIAVVASDAVLAAMVSAPAIGVNVAGGLQRRVRDAAAALDALIVAR